MKSTKQPDAIRQTLNIGGNGNGRPPIWLILLIMAGFSLGTIGGIVFLAIRLVEILSR